MLSWTRAWLLAGILIVGVGAALSAQAGALIVTHDEHDFSSGNCCGLGFDGNTANANRYVQNIASFFSHGQTGTTLGAFTGAPIYYYPTAFQASISAAGDTLQYVAPDYSAASLARFAGVFLPDAASVTSSDVTNLIDYFNHGGGIYVLAGNGAPPTALNALIGAFGLSYSTGLDTPCCYNYAIDPNAYLIFNGVTELSTGYGFEVHGPTSLIKQHLNGQGTIAVVGGYIDENGHGVVTDVPEPSSLALLLVGCVAIAVSRPSRGGRTLLAPEA